MDPLSLTVSALTILTAALGASKGISQLIQGFSNAPKELRHLLSELQDIRVVLTSAELMLKTNQETSWPIDPFSTFVTLLRRINEKLVEVETYCNSLYDTRSDSSISLKTVEWCISGKDKSKKFREELNVLRSLFDISLSTISTSSTLRIGFKVDKVEFEVGNLHSKIDSVQTIAQEQVSKTTAAFDSLIMSNDALQRVVEDRLASVRSELDESNLNMFLRGQLNSLLPPSAVAVHLSLQQRAMCVVSCPCACHQWQYFHSPTLFETLIGSMILGYTGIPLMTNKCKETRCRNRATLAVSLRYRFPIWLFTKVINFAVYSRYGSPTAGLSIARIRPHSSPIFTLAESGNLMGIKALFDKGMASPFDISEQTGDQPLHITATHGFVDASRMLVGYGADPHAWDQSRRNTPHLNAWNMILSKNVPERTVQQLSDLFANVNASFQFPRLHQLVLGLRLGSLETELQRPNLDIDVRDSAGTLLYNGPV